MKRSMWPVLICGLAMLGCGDDDGEPAANDASVRPPEAGRGGAGWGPLPGGAGMGASGIGGGVAGAVGPGPCFGMPCGCFDCGNGCFDCGMGCGFCGPSPQPEALPWEPPFAQIGTPGWRDSDQPFCGMMDTIYAFDVWSDARGVHVVASGVGFASVAPTSDDEDAGVPAEPSGMVPGMVPGGNEYMPRTKVFANDGSSWRLRADQTITSGDFEIAGVPNGPVLVHENTPPLDMGFGVRPCPLGVLSGGGLECLDLDFVQSAFGVNEQLGYVLSGGTRLLDYDGERWRAGTPLLPFPASAVWADASSVIAVGRTGTVLSLENGAWVQRDPGTIANLTAVWGAAADDLWVGTSTGELLHYDGEDWTQVGKLGGVTCSFSPPVTGIWGAGDHVYFHTDTQLARWDGSELETLANWSCSINANARVQRITGLYGNGPDELFLTMIDSSRFPVGGCGPTFVVYYDGDEFHRM